MRLQQYLNEDKTLDFLFEEGLRNLQEVQIDEQEIEVSESTKHQLNESISVTLIISVLLATPSIIQSIAKSVGFLYKKIKKLFGGKEESKAVEGIVNFTEKWHHMYISALRQILRMGGVFKSAGITDKDKQMKATEVVFYTIIFGFAVYGGVATAKSIMHVVHHATPTHINMSTLEGVLTSVKSKEVANFVRGIIKA